ncbi:hypothetical protein [Veillonella sp.]|uniref:hypothetical protein n=1 Tax=Veillonella sp. TaxID=1926307 RepID=UPI001B3E7AB0|nr:hypothetical protein [Veillonella sp.]MBP8617262.1 hypothetical protein [Veillonella sp.]MBP9516802.1 hypothetical protein [Veillonella sp.]MBP9551431.1 hypothetical protein [Veillonella sp.]
MKKLNRILSIIAFVYLAYHMYTYGVTTFNAVVMALFIVSLGADYLRYKRDAKVAELEKKALEKKEKSYNHRHKNKQ